MKEDESKDENLRSTDGAKPSRAERPCDDDYDYCRGPETD